MSGTLFACAWAAEFPAQALVRLRTDWQTEPVVVLDGRAPEEWVCSLNRLAERNGAAVGMTRLEAEGMRGLSPQRQRPVVGGPGLRLLKRSAESEAAARAVMLECAAKFSPRIEEAGGTAGGGAGSTAASTIGAGGATACAFVLDIAGTERLFGPPEQLAERLRDELAGAGFRAAIAVSANFDAARMKAAGIHGIAVIAEGAEAEALEKLPVAALDLDEEHAATFALWGIGTLGEMAALPEAELVARVGAQARRWRALARGEAEHAFAPIETVFALEEFCEFETPVEQIDSLLFVGARMIECLVARAAGRALALGSLRAEMKLEGGSVHHVAIRPAMPSVDKKFLLKLLQLEIGAKPPQAAVVALTLRAEAGAQSQVQLGLFAPQTPEPSRLDVTLARLRAMVGEERVGSPVLEDTHRAEGFRMEGFAISSEQVNKLASQRVSEPNRDRSSRMALRRVRPARTVMVMLRAAKPAIFRDQENSYEIAAAYGPWRTSGCWWALEAWDAEEWDVLAVRAEKLPSGAKAPTYLTADTARLKPCPFKTPSTTDPSGAKAQNHSSADAARVNSCPDTSYSSENVSADIEKHTSGAKAQNHSSADTARVNSCPDTSCLSENVSADIEKHTSGAKAQNHSSADAARVNSCPDTSCSSNDHFAHDGRASAGDSSKRNVLPSGERQPQILRLRPAAQGSAQDDKHPIGSSGAAVACLLVRDCARNVWRLEAFYD
jgi:protein ImuB